MIGLINPVLVMNAVRSVANSAPGAFKVVLSRLSAYGFTGKTVDDVIKWVSNNKVNTAMLAASIASVGFAVDGVDDEKVKAVGEGKLALTEFGKILAAGERSETLNLQVNEVEADLSTARTVLGWAKRHYGSERHAVHCHQMHQAFFEMPLADVISGFENLKVA